MEVCCRSTRSKINMLTLCCPSAAFGWLDSKQSVHFSARSKWAAKLCPINCYVASLKLQRVNYENEFGVAFILLTCFVAIGCNSSKVANRADSPQTNTLNVESNISSTNNFVPDAKSVVGDWYVVTTNPTLGGRIATDYIIYSFQPDGSVTKSVTSNGEKELDSGTYVFDDGKKTFEAKFDLGRAGVQITIWKQESAGSARIVYWQNLTTKNERKENELYVKKDSDEWARRGTVRLNTDSPVSTVDARSLSVSKNYRLSKETPLMPELEPANPIEAIGRMKKIPAGGLITIVKVTNKGNTPWYFVQAKASVSANSQSGWINSTALIGQSLEETK